MTSSPLAGYVAIVTGGGTGIGRACAARLARDGAAVTICGRRAEVLDSAVAAIMAEVGPDAVVHSAVADVVDEESVRALLDAVVDRDGRLDAVVANAGGGGPLVPYHLQPTDEFLRVLHLNVLGTFLLVKHAVPHLVSSGRGSFVGMSSIAGQITHPLFGAYTVSKSAVEEMMRNAADEYGATQTRFNAIRPGFIATEIMDAIPRDSEVFRSYITNTPLGGVGSPEHVGDLARFLVGPESAWITGQIINVDGGHSLRAGPDYSPFVRPRLGDDALLARKPAAS